MTNQPDNTNTVLLPIKFILIGLITTSALGAKPLAQEYVVVHKVRDLDHPAKAVCVGTPDILQLPSGRLIASMELWLKRPTSGDEGEATVEVLNEGMQLIDGFEQTSSVPLRGRSIEQSARWTTKADWSQLAGKRVRLRISIRNADLYAFWMKDSE